ncbi:SRPBCC family protein [bacterium SCSIO 12643]|nr:SRPBCC family protein [bacterium SCSIO 12643]
MVMLKKIILAIVAIVALVLIVAAIVPSEYSVKREVVIQRSNQEVFDYIKYLKNQDNFSTWAQKDPNMEKTFTGEDGKVGFTSHWNSEVEDVGEGEQEIMKIEDGKRIDFQLRFIKPFEATDMAYMTTEDMGGQTKVVWGFDGNMPYPSNLMLLFMDFEQMLGPELQTGLNNLKSIMENQ